MRRHSATYPVKELSRIFEFVKVHYFRH